MSFPDKMMIAFSIIYRKSNLWKNDRASQLGLTSAQFPIITLVCNNEGISQNKVVERLLLEKSVVAKSIGKLIELGYITRQQNEKDRRVYNLFPTDRALDICPEIVRQSKLCMELLTEGMTAEEKRTLSMLLEKVVANSRKLGDCMRVSDQSEKKDPSD